MEINMNSLMGKPGMLHTIEAEEGAVRLLKRIKNGDMGMEVLPNSYVQFTGELEEQDYISYCRFLKSANGKKVIRLLDKLDEGKYFEL